MPDGRDKGMGAFGTFLLGAAAGAAAMFLSKKENRDKINDKLGAVMEEGRAKTEEFKSQTRQAVKHGAKRVSDALDKAERELEEQQEKADRMTE